MTSHGEWTLTALYRARLNDLALCHTTLEREMVATITRKEILALANALAGKRKLTPGEETVLASIKEPTS